MIEIFQSVVSSKKSKYGLWDKTTKKIIVDPAYDEIVRFEETDEYYKIRVSNMWGVIDCKGVLILKTRFNEIFSFDGKKFIARRGKKRVFVEYPFDTAPVRKSRSSSIKNRVERDYQYYKSHRPSEEQIGYYEP